MALSSGTSTFRRNLTLGDLHPDTAVMKDLATRYVKNTKANTPTKN